MKGAEPVASNIRVGDTGSLPKSCLVFEVDEYG